MTTRSAISVNTFKYTNPFLSTSNLFMSIRLYISVIKDITKLFYIEILVISVYNIIALIYTNRIL